MGRVDFRSGATKRRERSFSKKSASVFVFFVTNLYRLDFHFIPSSHFPQRGKQGNLETRENIPKGKARKFRNEREYSKRESKEI